MKADKLLLDRVLEFEKTRADELYLTQPMGGGEIRTFTWAEAVREARRMAAYLKTRDFPPGSHIALVSKNTAWWMLTDLAIWMAGHVSVPLYPVSNRETVSYVLEHSESKLCFVGKLDHPEEILPGIPSDLPCVEMPLSVATDHPKWDDIVAEHEPLAEPAVRTGEELATIVYTSGSTGRPKGVMLSFEAMSIAAEAIVKALDVTSEDRMISYLPLAHVFERWIVECSSYCSGLQIFFAESLDTFVQDLKRARPTLFISVPRLWQKFQLGVMAKMGTKLNVLLKIPILGGIVSGKVLEGLGLDHCRIAGTGSAPIPPDLVRWYRNLGLELLEGYGMTENFCYSHLSRPGQMRIGYVGHAHEGVETRISDEGEILVKSPADMMGYYKQPELTKEVFTEDGFFRTGDRGELDEAGRLRITGRVKELFKTSKGKYVSPAPIESLLQEHPDVEMTCVGGAGHPQPHALVMLSDEALARAADPGARARIAESLGAHLDAVNGSLPHHERLQFLVVVKDRWTPENGFLTPTLKLRRAGVEDTYASAIPGWYDEGQRIIWQH